MIRDLIRKSADQVLDAVQNLQLPETQIFMNEVAHLLADTFQQGKKVLLAGNGGSLCDAAHFAEELTGIFREYRAALPAIVLNEPGHLSCIGNDLGYEWVFSRAIEAYAQPGDVFIGLTTSGNSLNIIRAMELSKKRQLKTVAFLGKDGGKLAGFADYEWVVPGFRYSDRIQEVHMAAIHIIIEAVEHLLFANKSHQTWEHAPHASQIQAFSSI